jgi:hypothetical protein
MRISNAALLILVSSATAVVGAGAGYKIAEKRLGAAFEERLAKETEEVRHFYTVTNKPSPAEAVKAMIPDVAGEELEAYQEALKAQKFYKGDKPQMVAYDKVPTTVKVVQGLKVDGEDSRTWAEEENERADSIETYVISDDEFNAGEKDYIQAQLTFYDRDKILVDSAEQKIEDVENHIGAKALLSFGGRSGDANVVYVRNNKLQLDFEVTRHSGAYIEEVLGDIYEEPIQMPSGRMRPGG